jgi:alpha-tubulin suppressor-like RCC1 family protein
VVLSTDTFHTCVIDRLDRLFCAGRNAEGQLGIPGTQFEPELRRVDGNFARVSVGRFFTCGVTSEGSIACAGANDLGQLGSLDTERRDEFTAVK